MNERVGIVIPSYNESANVVILVKQIKNYLPDAYITIVDDSNPQENKRLADSLNIKVKNKIFLISRLKKLGRGSAVFTGFQELLKDKSVYYFFEMDADLSHDPGEFELFLSAIRSKNADVVIGSRYLQNSKTIKWPLWRLLLSKLYNIVINIWLGLHLRDYTNGFRLYKRNAVEFLAKIQLREKGFISLSEIAFRLKTNNYKIVEIPITFKDRKHGKSNANIREYISALTGIIRIKIAPLQFKK